MLTIVGSLKSEKELQDISYRSLRSRVNNFRDKRSWPTGAHPFGYGKACFSYAGRLLWVFQPISRSKGQVFYADADGNLNPGPENVKIPRKDKLDKIELVISNNPRYVETIKVIFDLYVNSGWLIRRFGEVKNLHEIVSSFNRKPEACALRNTANTVNTPKRARLRLAVKRPLAKPPRNTG